MHKHKALHRILFAALAASMMTTEAILVIEGRWQEAIPLHLCSVSAIMAACLALFPGQILLDALWYLGMPGAALALLFPAPAVSRFQLLLTGSYILTHAMILIIPVCRMAAGMRPRGGRTGWMMLFLLALSAAAHAVNVRLHTDFLFLEAPPPGTPLERVYAAGYVPYLLFLLGMMSVLCMIMDDLARRLVRK